MHALFKDLSRRRRSGGFTMLELMAVVTVIAILAVIALPNFQNQIVRRQIKDALSLADIAKPPVATAWRGGQPLPADNAAAGLPVPDKIVSNYVTSLRIESGVIHLTFGNSANGAIKGKTLSIRPALVEDAPIVPVVWVCASAPVPGKMIVRGINRTDVPANFLPVGCR